MPKINLKLGKGSSKRGGGKGGFYWHIFVDNKRAGYVFINFVKDKIYGEHASINIHLNQAYRGKGIGSTVYKLAAKQSGYGKIYAHMRKSNIASCKAALNAGFKKSNDINDKQLTMIWRR